MIEIQGNVIVDTEGVFDGMNIVTESGEEYCIPSNYTSKSKLIEGDILRVIISDKGQVMCKQIELAEREGILAEAFEMEDGEVVLLHSGKAYRITVASRTFWNIKNGDKVLAKVPKDGKGKWAAVEMVIQRKK